jgi:hypothetical protein
MGPLTLEGLKPGQSRPLTPREVASLKQLGQSRDGERRPRRSGSHAETRDRSPI